MNFSTSSEVIPIPLSDTVMVLASLSIFTETFALETSPEYSPFEAKVRQLLRGIYCIRYDFTKEDVVIGIQKLFNNRE